jgi:hypothetical protein
MAKLEPPRRLASRPGVWCKLVSVAYLSIGRQSASRDPGQRLDTLVRAQWIDDIPAEEFRCFTLDDRCCEREVFTSVQSVWGSILVNWSEMTHCRVQQKR